MSVGDMQHEINIDRARHKTMLEHRIIRLEERLAEIYRYADSFEPQTPLEATALNRFKYLAKP